MQLKPIDKSRYSKHLKIVFISIAVTLIALTLGASTLLISLFSTPETSNFWFNLMGVVIAAVVVIAVLQKLRQHPFLVEVVYVWDLKQMLNRIYRKQRKIEPMVEQNDPDAMVIMNFQYKGSRQLYELDDNIITMDSLIIKLNALEKRMKTAGLNTSTDNFNPELLNRY